MTLPAADHTAKEAELLSLLRREMNGAVVDSMREKGLVYNLSYGVSLVDIKNISREFAPDHGLAKHLYPRDCRELRLAALHIADPGSVTAEELAFWSDGITTTEIASVGALALFSKTPMAGGIVFSFFASSRPLLRYTAIMTSTANLMHTKGRPDWNPRQLLDRIRHTKATEPENWTGYLEEALSTLQLRLEVK